MSAARCSSESTSLPQVDRDANANDLLNSRDGNPGNSHKCERPPRSRRKPKSLGTCWNSGNSGICAPHGSSACHSPHFIAGGNNSLHSIAHTQLLEELRQINFDGCDGQSKPLGNLPIGVTLTDVVEKLPFSVR